MCNFIKMTPSLYPSTRSEMDKIQFSMHRCNSVCGPGKIGMSLEKPSVYKKHKREGNRNVHK